MAARLAPAPVAAPALASVSSGFTGARGEPDDDPFAAEDPFGHGLPDDPFPEDPFGPGGPFHLGDGDGDGDGWGDGRA
jgi:hypothetical protein